MERNKEKVRTPIDIVYTSRGGSDLVLETNFTKKDFHTRRE